MIARPFSIPRNGRRIFFVRLDGVDRPEDVTITSLRWATEDDPCDACAALDGVQVRPGDTFPGTSVASPPLHKNCRCTLEVVDADGNAYAEYSLVGAEGSPYEEYSVRHDAMRVQRQIANAWKRRLARGLSR